MKCSKCECVIEPSTPVVCIPCAKTGGLSKNKMRDALLDKFNIKKVDSNYDGTISKRQMELIYQKLVLGDTNED